MTPKKKVAIVAGATATGTGTVCPSRCDQDCEVGPEHCSNVHVPAHKRTHDPDQCPGQPRARVEYEAMLARIAARNRAAAAEYRRTRDQPGESRD